MDPDLNAYAQRVAWWQGQADQVSKDRGNLRYILWAGVAASLPLSLWRPLIGAAGLLVTGVTWSIGLYMVTVRRYELAEKVQDAQAALERRRTEPPVTS